MNSDIELQKKLDMIIQISRANLKISNSIVQYISQSSLNSDNKLLSAHKDLKECLEELKKDIQELNKLSANTVHVYSDEELFNLKKSMSWTVLAGKTKIPISTLQYRHKRYVKEHMEKSGGLNYD